MKLSKSILIFLSMSCFIFADPPDWDSDGDGYFDNISTYQNSGSITSAVFINDTNMGSLGDMLGAFVGDELRGLGMPTSVPFGPYAGTYQFLTLVYSNEASGEQISFKLYDIETDEIYEIEETFELISDMTLGNITIPELLNGNSNGGSDGGDTATDGCELPENTVYLTDSGELLYNIPTDLGGYQFNVEGTTINGASGGESANAGFTVSAAGNTVLAFSFTGATVSVDCGILTTLSLAGDATGLSGLVFSDASAGVIDVAEFDPNDVYGCTGIDACNYNLEANVDDGSCEGNPTIGGPPTDACSMEENRVYLTDTGEIWYNIPTDLGGYQFNVEGTTINGASGGESANAGFTVSAAGNTVLAFSFTGATVSVDCGILTTLSLAGDATGLSGMVFSDSSANNIDVNYVDASGVEACDCDGNLEDECGVCGGDGDIYECGCSDISEGACDCNGNTDAGCGCGETGPSGCDETCGSTLDFDECGVCGGSGAVYDCGCTEIPNGDCDCDGNLDDCNGDCNGTAYFDECDICVGGGTELDACPIDCNGDFGGTAVTDACGDCVLGVTGLSFVEDTDDDGVCDTFDVCNGFDDNVDTDGDSLADGCDSCPLDPDNDADQDEICGDIDVCFGYDDNLDADGDNLADGCDSCPLDEDNDVDEDGICGDEDDCPFDVDNDVDEDGICGDVDTCPLDADNDVDNDGICGDIDICPNDINDDADSDGVCDCSLDSNENCPGEYDLCPYDSENDFDGDGICGDVDICPNDSDNDIDSDDICGDIDTCPFDAENDADDDGICGNVDDCPYDAADDADGDGVCANNEVYGCTDSLALNYNDFATENSGCIYDFETPPDEFSNNVSSSLAYYFIGSVTVQGTVLSPEDWLGAFNGDICVGARRWNTQYCSNGICDIPVYGDDGSSLTVGYMNSGDIPTFKVYDYDANDGVGAFYNVNGPDINGNGESDAGVQNWSNLGANYVPQLSIIRDCTDELGGSTFDSDQDGYCDCACLDVDDNGLIQDCSNGCDLDPSDINCWVDTDLDGSCDPYDLCPGFDDTINFDGDFDDEGNPLPDGCDSDDDNDGAFDPLDSDDNNVNICSDNDNDTCDDCSNGSYNLSNDGFDYDLDGACDTGDSVAYPFGIADIDDDNDGSLDDDDSQDNNEYVCSDADGDSCDDCSTGIFNINNDGWDYDQDGACDTGDSVAYPNGIADIDDDNDGALDENDYDDNNQYACSDTESFYFSGNDYIGDGCDDCSSGTFDIDNDGSDNDLDSLCDIGDFCDQDAANDIDDDGICFNEESLGCTNTSAINLDIFASDDDGSCLFSSTYNLDYHAGANLTSYSLHPTSNEFAVVDFSDLFTNNNLSSILGDVSATTNLDDIGWIGSLDELDRISGYWLKLEDIDTIEYQAYPHGQHVVSMDESSHQILESYYDPFEVSYSLNSGNNLISFPGENNLSECYMGDNGCEMLNYNLADVLPEDMDGILSGILGEGSAAAYIDGFWSGSLVGEGLSGFKGYWFRVDEDIDFNFNLSNSGLARNINKVDKEFLEGFEFVQSSSQSAYFIKNISGANIGDWIIAFNDDIVVGARRWNNEIIDVPVMGSDGESYSIGYIDEGDVPSLMLYNSQTGDLKPLHGAIPSYSINEIFIIDQLTTDDVSIPTHVTLHSAYPNPFNPVTNISFSLPSKMDIELNILDIQGRIVQKVVSNSYSEGLNSLTIDGTNLSSGLYFVQLIAGHDVQYTKVLLLK